MKEIPLTQGMMALVDDEDYEALSHWKWCYHPTGYAFSRGGVYMHRLINQTPDGRKWKTDHINGNRLDNRRANLRTCTQTENNRNSQGKGKKYKGVSWDSSRKRWVAQIMVNRKNIFIGRFDKIEDALAAYNDQAIIHHGQFARLNQL